MWIAMPGRCRSALRANLAPIPLIHVKPTTAVIRYDRMRFCAGHFESGNRR
jgi:hypothetical protein